MFNAIKSLNLLVRFGLEMCLLAAIAVACWRTVTNETIRLVATITLPIIVMIVWATVVHGERSTEPAIARRRSLACGR